MKLSDLIEQLQRIRLERLVEDAGNLPVILCTAGGSGECDVVDVLAHPDSGALEVRLQEKL
jgi:hypothetical protein